MSDDRPIGIFDSGIGGLTVAKKIFEYLPNENVIYFGDTARVPYGSKSNSTVIEYAYQDAKFLIDKNVKIIIVACNTVSSVAMKHLSERFNVPIIGMIEPGTKMAFSKTKNNKIGVIGTDATINNKAYSEELHRLNSNIEVYEKSCPLFVPLAEEGWLNKEATALIAEEYLNELKIKDVDTLILGCTHYPLLSNVIQKVMGNNVNLIDSGTAAALNVDSYLKNKDIILSNKGEHKENHFYVTDMPKRFRKVAELFLGRKIQNVHKIELEEIIT